MKVLFYLWEKLTPLLLSILLAETSIRPCPAQTERPLGQLGENFSSEQAELNFIKREQRKKLRTLNQLAQAKFFLINGNTQKALSTLKSLNPPPHSVQEKLKTRYLALTYFSQGDLKKSQNLLNSRSLQQLPSYSHICSLKILLNLGATPAQSRSLNQSVTKAEIRRCQLAQESALTESNYFWPRQIFGQLMQAPLPFQGTSQKLMKQYFLDLPRRKLPLMGKLALFSGKEEVLLPLIKKPDPEISSLFKTSPEAREVYALLSYRLGLFPQALDLIKDLKTPNSYNLQANIELLRGEEKKGFDFIKKALTLRPNSANALAKALPLSWALQDFKLGEKVLHRLKTSEKNHWKLKTLGAIFALRLKNDEKAKAYIYGLLKDFSKAPPWPLLHAAIELQLKTKEPYLLVENSRKACAGGSGSACWIFAQGSVWRDLPGTLERKDTPHPNSLSIRDLKGSPQLKPIQEEKFINQADILILDGL